METRPDQISIRSLRADARIGVPDEERASPQTIEIDIDLFPQNGFEGLNDEIEKTIDYDALSRQVRQWVATRECKLIETLISDLAAMLLDQYPLRRVGLEIRKFVLPTTECVAVRIDRSV